MLSIQSLEHLEDSRILITGGTGSLGVELTELILRGTKRSTVVIFSRDEYKQFLFQSRSSAEDLPRLRFFLGDVRDSERLRRALFDVDCVIHAAALKHVPAAEYNPFEFIKTNIIGAENVINACIDCGVKRVVALSTDKAANPINLYGASKLASDKLFVAANSFAGGRSTRFAVVRYGNVVGSRGSVVPFFLNMSSAEELPITDPRMTRFWITLKQGASLVLNAFNDMQGGEIYVPKIPSMRVVDLARLINPKAKLKEVGIRPGEKLHEMMVTVDDGRATRDMGAVYVIEPTSLIMGDANHVPRKGALCADNFYYSSDNNTQWVSDKEMTEMIANLDIPAAVSWIAARKRE